MKKVNPTYVMGILFIVFAAWVLWQTGLIPERLVSNEPGPKLFPYISGIGMLVMAVLAMIFEGKKDAEKHTEPYLDKDGWKRLALIMCEAIVFCIAMNWIGFWFTGMIGMMVYVQTLRNGKKINLPFAIILSIAIGSICYFGFTKGFAIPLPKGRLWSMLGIKMP